VSEIEAPPPDPPPLTCLLPPDPDPQMFDLQLTSTAAPCPVARLDPTPPRHAPRLPGTREEEEAGRAHLLTCWPVRAVCVLSAE
jgi:hypothetical protein